jgi:dihydroceramidase
MTHGYWGPVTSSVDWCEPNHTHTIYIAESFNSLSSLSLCLAACLGIALHWRHMTPGLLFSFISTFLIGSGSFAFHSTLLREAQLWDEIPMIYSSCSFNYILLSSLYPLTFTSTRRRILAVFLFCYAIGGSIAITVLRGDAQFYTFHVMYGLTAHPGTYLFYLLSKKSANPDMM